MINKSFATSKFCLNTVLGALISSGCLVHADEYFNPALLLNTAGSSIANLSNFEKGYQLPGNYKVDVYLNDEFLVAKEFNFQQAEKSHPVSGGLIPCVDSQWLLSIGVRIYDFPEFENLKSQNCIDIKHYIPEAEVIYNFTLQRLDISLPQIWVKNSVRGYIPPSEWDKGITAGSLNYNFNGSNSDNSDNLFLSLNSGFNIAGFRFKNLTNYSYIRQNQTNRSSSKWNNIQSYVEKSIVPLKSELLLGDSYTRDAIFDSVGFRGVRLYSSDAMLPNSMQGYAPVIRGIANSKSVVTIRQNGYTVYQTNVAAGPFEIKDLSSMSLSGDLNVTVEESSGGIQNFIVPYSGVPILLREGRTKFDIAAGEFRSGNQNQAHPFFVQGSISKGLGFGVTAYGGIQLAKDYQAGLIGIGKNMGNWGAFSFDATHANSTLADNNDYKGQSYRLLYSKSLNTLGTAFQLLGYRYSTKGFYTLNDVSYRTMENFNLDEKYDKFGNIYYDPASYYNLNYTRKGQFQFNVTQNLKSFGSLYASANYQTYWNAPNSSRSYQVGYANNFKYITYTLSWSLQDSYNLLNEKTNTIAASISLPLNAFFGPRDRVKNEIYSSGSIVRDSSGSQSIQTGLNGSLLDDRQLSYSILHGRNNETGEFGTAAMHFDTKYASGGVAYNFSESGKNKSINYDLSGGMILHSGGLTLGQSLGDTNILIDAKGAKNVKIENSHNISTDSRGYAILSSADNYRLNRIALAADSLNDKTEILTNVQNLVPMKGAILKAKFDTRIGQRALISLKHLGQYVPYGSTVTEENLNINSIVGQDGQTYLSGLAEKGSLKVTWGTSEKDSCRASYHFDQKSLAASLLNLELNCE